LTVTSHLRQPGVYRPSSFRTVKAGTLCEAARETGGRAGLNAPLAVCD